MADFFIKVEDILNLSTVEAKEIVHAKWKYIRTVNGKDYYECQNCKGYDSVKSKIKTHNFCKHCGAEMEGVE